MSVIEQTVKLASLTVHPDNPRQIDDEQLEALKTSLKEFPEMLEARPIVVNKTHQIIGGNQRYRALLALGETEATVKIVDWSDAKQHEFMLKDNTEKGEWDYTQLLDDWKTEDLSNWGVSIGTWNPTLQPDTEGLGVTQTEIDNKEAELANRFSEPTGGEQVEITCEDCGEKYYVDK